MKKSCKYILQYSEKPETETCETLHWFAKLSNFYKTSSVTEKQNYNYDTTVIL